MGLDLVWTKHNKVDLSQDGLRMQWHGLKSDGTELRGAGDSLEGQDAILRDLGRLG